MEKQNEFPTWKTIKIGDHRSPWTLLQDLIRKRFQVSKWAEDVFASMIIAESKMEIELVVVTIADLGFTQPTRRDTVYDRANELGLFLCQPEFGAQLRLQYADQPMDDILLIAMEHVVDHADNLVVFHLGSSNYGVWLHTCICCPDTLLNPWYRCVFALRIKQN